LLAARLRCVGGKVNALPAATGFNFRKLIREYARIFLRPIPEGIRVLFGMEKRSRFALTTT
jgi:hypothetical protein